jgi:large subunit ribosomal protein L7/L12
MSKVQELVSEIKNLSVVEVVELSEALQEVFGVSAVAAAAPVAQAGGADAAEEKTSFKVELVTAPAENKIKIIKALRSLNSALGLTEAKKAAEEVIAGTPFVIFTEANKENAENAKKVMKEVGADVKLS